MSSLAFKKSNSKKTQLIMLVEAMEIKNSEDRKWFRRFLKSILSSPDLDYSQFERCEYRRTARQMRHEMGIF